MAATLQLKQTKKQGWRSPGQVQTKTLLETKGFVNPIEDDDEIMTGYPESAIKYADIGRGQTPIFFQSGDHFAQWMIERGVNVRNIGETIFWTEPLSDAEIVIVANINFQF